MAELCIFPKIANFSAANCTWCCAKYQYCKGTKTDQTQTIKSEEVDIVGKAGNPKNTDISERLKRVSISTTPPAYRLNKKISIQISGDIDNIKSKSHKNVIAKL